MTGAIVVSIGAILACGWGVAHLFATKAVVSGFGTISADNRRIIAMKWITEGVFLVFIGILIGAVTYVDRSALVSRAVAWTVFGALNILSVVSLFTGFKNSFVAFKLCPIIFTGSSVLILVGSYLE